MAASARTRSRSGAPVELLGRLLARPEALLVLLLGVTCLIMGRLSPFFWTPENLLDLPRLFVEPAIVMLAMTAVILTGGIDLSVGSVLAFSAVVLGLSWQAWGLPFPLCVVLALVGGLGAGAVNGLIITRFGVPPLVTTLATMLAFRGLALGLCKAQTLGRFPPAFGAVAGTYVPIGIGAGLPAQFLGLLVLLAAIALLLTRTRWGRYLQAIGHNEEGARYAAIRVERVKLALYSLTGLAAALAALVQTSRFTAAKADLGADLALEVITACVLGGVDINGGRGTVTGAFLGLLVIAVLRDGLRLAQVATEWQEVLVGLLLVGAVGLNQLARRGAPGSTGE